MAITLRQFVDSVVAAGLLTADQIEAAGRSVLEAGADDPAKLVEALVQAGLLTRFQAANACRGRAARLVLGNYVLLDKLGAGGMGEVYLARHRRLERTVALKVLSRRAHTSPAAVERFLREGKAAARLSHPNIVAVHDADEASGVPFLVMEYVEGRTLTAVVRGEGPLPVDRAVDFILQAARGLEHAHAAGIIHRDIKPANLLVDRQAVVKVLDMGLARIADAPLGDTANNVVDTPEAALTAAGHLMGTVDFMSPEQALATHSADAQSDVYSLGCTLHYLLTGRPPYSGQSVLQRLMAHRDAAIPSLRTARADVPAALDAVFQRMVAKQPAQRFASMRELSAALESSLAAANLPAAAAARSGATVAAPMERPAPASATARRARTVGAVVAAAGLIVVLGWALFRRSDETAQAPAAPDQARPADNIVTAATAPPADLGQDDTASGWPAVAPAHESTNPEEVPARPVQSDPRVAEASAPTAGPTAPPPSTAERPPTPPARAPASSPDVLLGPMIGVDLLKEVDLDRDVVRGDSWRFDGNVLSTASSNNSLLVLPSVPADEQYVLKLSATRRTGRGRLAMGFVAGERQAYFELFGQGGRGGLGAIDDVWPAADNETTFRGFNKGVDVPFAIVCRIERGRIAVEIDGTTMIDWKGEFSRLSGRPWRNEPAAMLFIASTAASFDIQRWELLTVDGKAGRLAPLAAEPVVASRSGSAARRDPVPDEAAWKAALEAVRQVLRDDYAKGARPADKALLVEKLLRQADRTDDDPTARYALLVDARDMAIDLGHQPLLDWAIDELVWSYKLDLAAVSAEAYEQMSRKRILPPAARTLAVTALELAARQRAVGGFSLADRLAAAGLAAARKAQDAALVRRATELAKQTAEAAALERSAAEAAETLAARPDDAHAHLLLGRFLCFTRGDWRLGWVHLARGDEPALAVLAEQSMAVGDDAAAQARLADAWLIAAGQVKGRDRQPLKAEMEAAARYWYQRALPRLSGLPQAAARQRLEQLAASTDRSGGASREPAGGADRAVALACLGGIAPKLIRGNNTVTVRLNDNSVLEIATAEALPSEPFVIEAMRFSRTGPDTPLEGLVALLPELASLKSLDLAGGTLGDHDAAPFAQLATLESLTLARCQIGNGALVHLRPLERLTTLRISNVNIGDEALIHLRRLTQLRMLMLNNTQVTDAGLIHLKGLKNLETLELRTSSVTDEGAARLQTHLPGCSFRR